MLITILVITRGVQRGIERVSVVLMPTLFFLIAALAVWASTLSGGGPGYAFYLQPDLSELFEARTITGAAGQAFFSLSLGMGAMITYASYLPGRGSLPAKAGLIALSDTMVAFVGGLVTFPVIFHFGLQQQVSDSAIGALFIAVPRGLLSFGSRRAGRRGRLLLRALHRGPDLGHLSPRGGLLRRHRLAGLDARPRRVDRGRGHRPGRNPRAPSPATGWASSSSSWARPSWSSAGCSWP